MSDLTSVQRRIELSRRAPGGDFVALRKSPQRDFGFKWVERPVSGSVITKDVSDDAMAVERSPQNSREGGAARYRAMKMRAKAVKKG